MIRSMTAFARQERKTQWGVLGWELRSLNHRYLELGLRLPEEFRVLEARIREGIGARLRRGKVEGTLRYQPAATGQAEFSLDEDLVRRLLEVNSRIEGMMENPARTRSIDMLRWPGVLQTVEHDLGQLQAEAASLLEATLQEMVQTRLREGAMIKGLISQRCQEIRRQVELVRGQLPAILDGQRRKLRTRLEELEVKFDNARLEQELVYLAQKMDVQEELDRLLVHLEEVERVLEQDEPVGRRLDFLMQELNREANTLGSKSVDAITTRASVEMKVVIEQMREQIQNIE
jgi:uncharacterized protein (TIGR00255 family)